jgi:hypothetical protein
MSGTNLHATDRYCWYTPNSTPHVHSKRFHTYAAVVSGSGGYQNRSTGAGHERVADTTRKEAADIYIFIYTAICIDGISSRNKLIPLPLCTYSVRFGYCSTSIIVHISAILLQFSWGFIDHVIHVSVWIWNWEHVEIPEPSCFPFMSKFWSWIQYGISVMLTDWGLR